MYYNSIREYVINFWNYITGESAAAAQDRVGLIFSFIWLIMYCIVRRYRKN
jgi:hypothetical protein